MEANETTGSLKEIGKSDPLEIGSRIISGIFTPFMVPFLAFFLLFFFTYLRITFGLWAIFHARACSRPPEPNNNTFMGSFTIYNVQFVCAVGHQVSCTDCYT